MEDKPVFIVEKIRYRYNIAIDINPWREKMEIKIMTIDDYEDVYQLWLSCKGMGLNNIDDSKEGINHFLTRNPETCFVATNGTKIIGVILAGNDGRRGYIYHLAVLPSYQHQGIGTKLVDAVLKALEKIGIIKVALVVFEYNEAGNAFWQKQGFRAREDLEYLDKALTKIIRMDT